MAVAAPRMMTLDRALRDVCRQFCGPSNAALGIHDDACSLLTSRLTAVEALHRRSTDHPDGLNPYCVGCWEAGGLDGAPDWPCPTLRALRGDA